MNAGTQVLQTFRSTYARIPHYQRYAIHFRDLTTPPTNPAFPDPRDPHQHPLAEIALDATAALPQRSKTQKPETEKRMSSSEARTVGRRKRSVAYVHLREGTGCLTVNGVPWVDYFHRIDQRDKILRPLSLLGVVTRYDADCRVFGGGVNGQTEAVRLGIARALQECDPHMRPTLKADGLLTRDSRVVEKKKYGRKKARKSFTWVKR